MSAPLPVLYHTPKAPNPERVVAFLRAKGRLDSVEVREISIMELEHKTLDYRAVSPFSQIPALVLPDGTALTESRAICTYLEKLHPEPNLMGASGLEAAQIEMWDRRVEQLWFFPFAAWFRNTHPRMAVVEKPQLPKAGAKGEKGAKRFAAFIADHLETHDFIAADRFTIADITAHLACGFCSVMGWKPHEEHASIGRWRARMKTMPAFAA